MQETCVRVWHFVHFKAAESIFVIQLAHRQSSEGVEMRAGDIAEILLNLHSSLAQPLVGKLIIVIYSYHIIN